MIDVRPHHTRGAQQLLIRKVRHLPETPMPMDLKPMLASITEEAFNNEGWQFELKFDGYRALAYLQKDKVSLRSRNNNSFQDKFRPVYEALKEWKVRAVVDGEIVVLDENGRPDFNGIQHWAKRQTGELVYYVFDLLWLEGHDLTQEPLSFRREILKALTPQQGIIRFSDHIDEAGKDFFAVAKKNNLEGIIAKRKDSPYVPGDRTSHWLKIKAETRHEAVICGYARKADTVRPFSSLILGVPEGKKMRFIGQAGTGYTAAIQQDLMKRLKKLETSRLPFDVRPVIKDEVVWLRPQLVCEVKYTEMTKDGIMRHASFQGLREDKAVSDINRE